MMIMSIKLLNDPQIRDNLNLELHVDGSLEHPFKKKACTFERLNTNDMRARKADAFDV